MINEFDVKIRTIKDSDIAQIAQIYADYALGTVATFDFEPISQPDFRKKLGKLIENGYPVLVAELHETVAGFAFLAGYREKPAYRWSAENTIYLASEARQKGIGEKLLRALIELAPACGIRQIVAVIADNQEASIALHKKCGYETIGVLKNIGYKHGRWLDTTLMQLSIRGQNEDPPSVI